MALYHSHVIHWPLHEGEFVAHIRHPFFEYEINHIFRVVKVYNDFTIDIECVSSEYIPLGTIYSKQPYRGFRKVKRTPITNELRYTTEV